MSVNITVKIFCLGILDIASLRQPYALRILSCHIYHNVGRNPLFHIGQPFDRTGIDKRGYAYRLVLVVDLCVQGADLELGYHINQRTHLPVAQKRCRAFVQKRNFVIIHLCNILCKGSFLNGQQFMVFFRIHDWR